MNRNLYGFLMASKASKRRRHASAGRLVGLLATVALAAAILAVRALF